MKIVEGGRCLELVESKAECDILLVVRLEILVIDKQRPHPAAVAL